MNCPCGTENNFSECCEPYLKGKKFPPTAEKLMRSRYTAYVYADIDYLKNTLAPESRTDFDPVSTKDWAKQAKWKKLKTQPEIAFFEVFAFFVVILSSVFKFRVVAQRY